LATEPTNVQHGKFGVRDTKRILTPEHYRHIQAHAGQLVALRTAPHVDAQAECPVAPAGRHQWYALNERRAQMPLLPDADATRAGGSCEGGGGSMSQMDLFEKLQADNARALERIDNATTHFRQQRGQIAALEATLTQRDSEIEALKTENAVLKDAQATQQRSYDTLYSRSQILQNALVEARAALDTEVLAAVEAERDSLQATVAHMQAAIEQSRCELDEQRAECEHWREMYIGTRKDGQERLRHEKSAWDMEKLSLLNQIVALQRQVAQAQSQRHAQAADDIPVTEKLFKKLMAMAHPDKWSQGQPAAELAHTLAVELNRLRQEVQA
jgi:hypothetical protein